MPDVSIRELRFDLGCVTVGSSAHHPLTLVNASPVPVEVAVDLMSMPEWHVAPPAAPPEDGDGGGASGARGSGDDDLGPSIVRLDVDHDSVLSADARSAAGSRPRSASVGGFGGGGSGMGGRRGSFNARRGSIFSDDGVVVPAAAAPSRCDGTPSTPSSASFSASLRRLSLGGSGRPPSTRSHRSGGVGAGGGSRRGLLPDAGAPDAVAAGGASPSDDEGGDADGEAATTAADLADAAARAAAEAYAHLPRRFRLKLPPRSAVGCELIFCPCGSGGCAAGGGKARAPAAGAQNQPQTHTLPVTIAGLEPPASTAPTAVAGLMRTATATPMQPSLVLEPGGTVVDFHYRVLPPLPPPPSGMLTTPPARVPYTKSVLLHNVGPSTLVFALDTSLLPAAEYATPSPAAARTYYAAGASHQPPVFSVSPTSGTLPPGGSAALSVCYCPSAARASRATLPLFVRAVGSSDDVAGQQQQPSLVDAGQPYAELSLRGTAVPPQLAFADDELVLPPVPLGAPATGATTVRNCGYDWARLCARVCVTHVSGLGEVDPADGGAVAAADALGRRVAVTFPDGDVLSLARPSLRLAVAFASPTPVAFRGVVEVSVALGAAAATAAIAGGGDAGGCPLFTLPLSATADNSPLTTALPQLLSAAPPDGLRQLLNSALFTRRLLTAFPGDLLASDGGPLLDAVAALAGGDLPPALRQRPGSRGAHTPLPLPRRARVAGLLHRYAALLGWLTERSGAVAGVRPWQMLGRDDFVYFTRRAAGGGPGGERPPGYPAAPTLTFPLPAQLAAVAKAAAGEHAAVAATAWATVAAQCARLLSLPRLTPAAAYGAPGVRLQPAHAAYRGWLVDRKAALAAVAAQRDPARPDARPRVASSTAATTRRATGGGRDVDTLSLSELLQEAKAVDAALAAHYTAPLPLASSAATAAAASSAPESVLLAWVSHHCTNALAAAAVLPPHTPVSVLSAASQAPLSSLAGLDDGVGYLLTVLSHAPHLGRPGGLLDARRGGSVSPQASAFVGAVSSPVATATTIDDDTASLPSFVPAPTAPEHVAGNYRLLDAALARLQLAPPIVTADVLAPLVAATGADGGCGGTTARTYADALPTNVDDGASTEPLRFGRDGLPVCPPPPLLRLLPGCPAPAAAAPRKSALLSAPTPPSLPSAAAAAHLAFGSWLLAHLPAAVPARTLDFVCALGASATRTLAVRNPSPVAVTYEVRLEAHASVAAAVSGRPEFVVDGSDTVTVPSHGAADVTVVCTPAISTPAHARLSLVPQPPEAGAAGSLPAPRHPLVYALRSVVTSRLPLSTRAVEAAVYATAPLEVEVRSQLPVDAVFTVAVVPRPLQRAPEEVVADVARTQAAHPSPFLLPPPPGGEQQLPPPPSGTDTAPLQPFWCKHVSVTLHPGRPKRLLVHFQPLWPGALGATLLLTESGGRAEVAVDLVGTATLPTAAVSSAHTACLAVEMPRLQREPVTRELHLQLTLPLLDVDAEVAAAAVADSRVPRAQRPAAQRAREDARGAAADAALAALRRLTAAASGDMARAAAAAAGRRVRQPAAGAATGGAADGAPSVVAVLASLSRVGTLLSVAVDNPAYTTPPWAVVPHAPLAPPLADGELVALQAALAGGGARSGGAVMAMASPLSAGASPAPGGSGSGSGAPARVDALARLCRLVLVRQQDAAAARRQPPGTPAADDESAAARAALAQLTEAATTAAAAADASDGLALAGALQAGTRLPLRLRAGAPGEYAATLTLTSVDGRAVRTYRVVTTVSATTK